MHIPHGTTSHAQTLRAIQKDSRMYIATGRPIESNTNDAAKIRVCHDDASESTHSEVADGVDVQPSDKETVPFQRDPGETGTGHFPTCR